MAPSASKQKRLAEKAAKQASKGGSASTGTSTPAGTSTNGGSTPLTSLSANGSSADLVEDAKAEMAKLSLKTDRSAVSVLSFGSGGWMGQGVGGRRRVRSAQSWESGEANGGLESDGYGYGVNPEADGWPRDAATVEMG